VHREGVVVGQRTIPADTNESRLEPEDSPTYLLRMTRRSLSRRSATGVPASTVKGGDEEATT